MTACTPVVGTARCSALRIDSTKDCKGRRDVGNASDCVMLGSVPALVPVGYEETPGDIEWVGSLSDLEDRPPEEEWTLEDDSVGTVFTSDITDPAGRPLLERLISVDTAVGIDSKGSLADDKGILLCSERIPEDKALLPLSMDLIGNLADSDGSPLRKVAKWGDSDGSLLTADFVGIPDSDDKVGIVP